MNEHDMRVLAVFANAVFLSIMLGSGLWVGYDARKSGCNRAETILWALFATMFIGVGLISYIFFRNKVYRR